MPCMYFILESLDGKDVTETSRQFLKNWQANKEAQKKKRQSGISRQASGIISFGRRFSLTMHK